MLSSLREGGVNRRLAISLVENSKQVTMNYAIQYWPPGLQEYLKNNYRYEPATGFVTRRLKDKGPVGSITKNNDLLIGVTFEGKQWMLRVTKLAYFLATGQQFHKFAWKDDNKLNNELSNLVPIGKELQPDMIYNVALEDQMTDRLRTQHQRQLEATIKYRQDVIDKREKFEEQRKYELRQKIVYSPEMLAWKKMHDEKKKIEYEKELAEAKRVKSKEELETVAKKGQEFIDKCKTTWRNGIFTGCSRKQADLFIQHCNEYSGQPMTVEELFANIPKLGYAQWEEAQEHMEKWIVDRHWVAYWFHWEKENGTDTINRAIARYQYKGQDWLGTYGEVPAGNQPLGETLVSATSQGEAPMAPLAPVASNEAESETIPGQQPAQPTI